MNRVFKIVAFKKFKANAVNIAKYSSAVAVTNEKWNGIVKNAEKVVGYPTSFLSLRWLLNDEVSNIAFHLAKLIGTNHPIIEIARNLLQQNEFPKWGLIVLLISKAAGVNSKVAEIERDLTSGILHNQRALAEITEMLRTGHTLHSGIMKIRNGDEHVSDLNFGNKIAILSGDYLYSKSFQELALLRNHNLNELISTSLRDLAELEFLKPQNENFHPLPSHPKSSKKSKISKLDPGPYDIEEYLGNPREEWILRTLLNGANLLAKSCKGALILGGNPEFLQEQAYIFGRSLALAWQANEDIKPFMNKNSNFSLVSAPVLFHLHAHPELYQLFESDVNKNEIRKIIVQGVGIEETTKLLSDLIDEALEALDYFPDTDAKDGLVRIARALEFS